MAEGQVSADGETRTLPQPFIVVATQNPFEFEGTYSLPESQMDRFLLRTSIGYPDRENERQIIKAHRAGEPVDTLNSVVSVEQVIAAQAATREINFDETLVEYLLQIVDATRRYEGFKIGVSTRAALSFYRACQARAVTESRDYVTPDDVKSLAVPVLSHRVMVDEILQGNERRRVEQQITELLQQVAVPV